MVLRQDHHYHPTHGGGGSSSLSRCCDSGSGQQAAQLLPGAPFWKRYADVEAVAAETRPRYVVEILETLATAHRKHVFIFQRLRSSVLRCLNDYGAPELAAICHAFVVVGFLREDFAVSIASRAAATVHLCTPGELSRLLDAFASLRCGPPELLRRVTAESIRCLRGFTLSELATHVSSFARLNSHSARFFSLVAERLVELNAAAEESSSRGSSSRSDQDPVEFTARDLTLFAYAFAKLGFYNKEVFRVISKRGKENVRDFTAHQIQMVVVAYQRAGIRDLDFLAKLSTQAQRRMAQFNAESIALLVRSFALFSIRDLPLFTRIVSQLPRLILTFRPLDLATTLNAFAQLSIPSVALTSIALPHALAEQEKFLPTDLQSVVRSCARLGFVHREFLRMVVQRCSPQRLPLTQLLQLSRDLTNLGFRHPSYHMSLVREALQTSARGPMSTAQAAELLADLLWLQLPTDGVAARVRDDSINGELTDPAAAISLGLAAAAAELDGRSCDGLPRPSELLRLALERTAAVEYAPRLNVLRSLVELTTESNAVTGLDALAFLLPHRAAWGCATGETMASAEQECLLGLRDVAGVLVRRFDRGALGLILYYVTPPLARDELEYAAATQVAVAETSTAKRRNHETSSPPADGSSVAVPSATVLPAQQQQQMESLSSSTPHAKESSGTTSNCLNSSASASPSTSPSAVATTATLSMAAATPAAAVPPAGFLTVRDPQRSPFSRAPWHCFLSAPQALINCTDDEESSSFRRTQSFGALRSCSSSDCGSNSDDDDDDDDNHDDDNNEDGDDDERATAARDGGNGQSHRAGRAADERGGGHGGEEECISTLSGMSTTDFTAALNGLPSTISSNHNHHQNPLQQQLNEQLPPFSTNYDDGSLTRQLQQHMARPLEDPLEHGPRVVFLWALPLHCTVEPPPHVMQGNYSKNIGNRAAVAMHLQEQLIPGGLTVAAKAQLAAFKASCPPSTKVVVISSYAWTFCGSSAVHEDFLQLLLAAAVPAKQ